MPPRRRRRPHNRPLTANKLGLPPEAHKRYREEQAKQRAALQQVPKETGGICPECAGSGLRNRRPCLICKGTGTATKLRTFPGTIGEALKAKVAAQEGQRSTMNALVQALASDPVKMLASMPVFMGNPSAGKTTPAAQQTQTGRFTSQPAIQQLPVKHPSRVTRWEEVIQGREPIETKSDGTKVFLIPPGKHTGEILLPGSISSNRIVQKGPSQALIVEVKPRTSNGNQPVQVTVKSAKEAPKREGTLWELPEQEEPLFSENCPLPHQVAEDHLRERMIYGLPGTYQWQAQPVQLTTGQPILDEIEVEMDPFDLDKPLVGEYLDVEDSQTGHKMRAQIANIVSTPGPNGEDILHLILRPPPSGFDVNHLRVEWVHRSGRYKPLHLSPAFKVEKAKELVERAFREHMNQYLGAPTSAVTIRDVKALAERVISRLKTTTVLPDHLVEVTTDPLEPGKINVTVQWKNDPTLMNILAKELDENLPAGVQAVLKLEEPEEEEPKEVKRVIGREQSFWKLPKS